MSVSLLLLLADYWLALHSRLLRSGLTSSGPMVETACRRQPGMLDSSRRRLSSTRQGNAALALLTWLRSLQSDALRLVPASSTPARLSARSSFSPPLHLLTIDARTALRSFPSTSFTAIHTLHCPLSFSRCGTAGESASGPHARTPLTGWHADRSRFGSTVAQNLPRGVSCRCASVAHPLIEATLGTNAFGPPLALSSFLSAPLLSSLAHLSEDERWADVA